MRHLLVVIQVTLYKAATIINSNILTNSLDSCNTYQAALLSMSVAAEKSMAHQSSAMLKEATAQSDVMPLLAVIKVALQQTVTAFEYLQTNVVE